jgi:hypothetical protein
MLTTTTTTTTTTTRAVEHPIGTVIDVVGGVYEGHIGRVKRYTAQRVVIALYPALGRSGAKQTLNKEITIKASNTKARSVEHPVGTVIDVVGGVYEGHIGRVKRYTAQRVVIALYPALGRSGAKQTLNKEITIKASNTKARALETESTSDDESSIESSIKHSNIKATADDESLCLLASFVASQIKRQRSDCTTLIKKRLLQRVNELLEGGLMSC